MYNHKQTGVKDNHKQVEVKAYQLDSRLKS